MARALCPIAARLLQADPVPPPTTAPASSEAAAIAAAARAAGCPFASLAAQGWTR